MLIYEVNVELLDKTIKNQYLTWLSKHIEDILRLRGFASATVMTDSEDPSGGRITVQYLVRNQRELDRYLKLHAKQMREDGLKRFPKQFRAKRRILKLGKTYTARSSFMDLNLDGILKQLGKFSNVQKLRKEIKRITKELKALQKTGTDQAKQQIKDLEGRYAHVLQQLAQLQDRVDQEVSKTVEVMEKTRNDVLSTINAFRDKAIEQKDRILGGVKKKKSNKKAVKSTASSAKTATKKVRKKADAKKPAATKKATKKVAAKKTGTKKAAKKTSATSTAKAKTTKKVASRKTTKKVTRKKAAK